MSKTLEKLVRIPIGEIYIEGMLRLPENARGIVLFAHGSGSSRHSPRNNYVAQVLQDNNIGTLLLDLLTAEEDTDYQTRFDIALLTRRLIAATGWVKAEALTKDLAIGYFGASTGAAAALQQKIKMILVLWFPEGVVLTLPAVSILAKCTAPLCCWWAVGMMW